MTAAQWRCISRNTCSWHAQADEIVTEVCRLHCFLYTCCWQRTLKHRLHFAELEVAALLEHCKPTLSILCSTYYSTVPVALPSYTARPILSPPL